jgi:hypothetical protein
MAQTRGQRFEIVGISDVREAEGSVQFSFQGGLTATLPTTHPDKELFLLEADLCRRYQRPVGVVVDEVGHLVDLNHTADVSVRRLGEDEDDPNRLVVGFWGFSAVCYLVRDHPNFERIRTTLEEAAATGSRVWFANYTWPEKSETEIWNRIMDVRPVQAPVKDVRVVATAPGTGAGRPNGARSGETKPGEVSTATGA